MTDAPCPCPAPSGAVLHGCNLDYFVTSQPYPVEVIDALGVVARLASGALWGIPEDNLSVSAAITGGTLQAVVGYLRNDFWTEGMDVSAAITGGTLQAILGYVRNDYWPAEALDASAAITGGSILTVLGYLRNDYWPAEALDVSAAITGGTLV